MSLVEAGRVLASVRYTRRCRNVDFFNLPADRAVLFPRALARSGSCRHCSLTSCAVDFPNAAVILTFSDSRHVGRLQDVGEMVELFGGQVGAGRRLRMQESVRGPDRFDRRLRTALRGGLGAGGPRSLSTTLATDKDAEDEEQNQEDDSQQHPRDNPDFLGQGVVHRQNDLVDLELETRAGLEQHGSTVVVDLSRDASDFPVVVIEVGLVDGGVSDVSGVS